MPGARRRLGRAVGLLLLVVIFLAPFVPAGPVALAAEPSLEPSASPVDEAVAGLQPDILVVMVDDLGYLPDDRVLERLPNIRETWLDGGLRFERIYTETPLCCPARATFLSGRHTLDHGVITNDGDPLDASTTIATALDEAGYHTMLMGKYLNDYEGPRMPPGWDRVMMRERNVGASFSVDGEMTRFRDMNVDDALREQAAEWIREAPADQPFFALLSPRAPHRHPQTCGKRDRECQYLPLVMEEDQGAEECAGIKRFKPPGYRTRDNGRSVPWVMPRFRGGWPLVPTCESLLVVDRMVGEVKQAMAGRDRPAYLVFLSDNGMSWGQKGLPQKHVPSAGRLPFYVAGPGVVAGTSEALVSNLDIAPTLAELGGTAMDVPGHSLVPLLAEPGGPGREAILEIMPPDPKGKYEGWAAIRTPRWHFIRWEDGRRELFDLAADPWELKNVAPDRRRKARELGRELRTLLAPADR